MQGSPLVNLHELWNFLKTYQAEHKVHSPYSQRLNKGKSLRNKRHGSSDASNVVIFCHSWSRLPRNWVAA